MLLVSKIILLFRQGIRVALILAVMNVTVHGQSEPAITVDGEVAKSLKLLRGDLLKMKQAEVKAKDHGGQLRKYSGVNLVDVLTAAGVTLGSQLRGKNLSKYAIVSAADGYEAVFSLPEIDPEFSSQTILLALKVDDEDLPTGDGPFRIVVPGDKKHARWIREVTSIRIVIARK